MTKNNAEQVNLCNTCTMGSNFVGFCKDKMTPHTTCECFLESESIKRASRLLKELNNSK